MRITVHRGSHQIGGSCIEVSSGRTRIILDAGLPLDSDAAASPMPPDVTGLFDRTRPAVDALFLSHAHVDHTGLAAFSRAEVPIWLSGGTSKMVLAGRLFARQPGVKRQRCRTLVAKKPVTVGELRITAFSVDHSVFDAMAFLVESHGQRILYTGDLRFHGRKPGMARELVRFMRGKPLDALIIEGTRLGARSLEANFSEANLESQIELDVANASGAVLALYSPLNVDRFVTLYRAALKTGRTMVVDPYQAFVLHLIRADAKLPRPGTASLKVLVPPRLSSSRAGRSLAHTRWIKSLASGEIAAEAIRDDPKNYLLLFRPSMQPWLWPAGLPEKVTCLFSYWPGYLREERMKTFMEEVKQAGGRLVQRHASGHAHPEDLRTFVEALRPRLLVPVHTTSPEAWLKWWPGTRVVKDGEAIEVT